MKTRARKLAEKAQALAGKKALAHLSSTELSFVGITRRGDKKPATLLQMHVDTIV